MHELFARGLRAARIVLAPALILAMMACGSLDGELTVLGHCGHASGGDEAGELRVVTEWEVGGSSDTALVLSPPLVFPTVAPGNGLSFARRFEAPIVTLDRDGSVRSSIGRPGTGPGEWGPQTTAGIAWFGDTLHVVQGFPPRLHVFTESGDLIASRQLRHGSENRIWPIRVLRNLDLVGAVPSRIEGGPRRLARWTDGSSDVDSLDVFQANATYRVEWPGGAFAIAMRPIVDDVLEASAPDGRSFVLVNRPVATRMEPSHFRIRKVRDDGTRVLDLLVCYMPVPIPEDEAADTIAAHAARLLPSAPGVPARLAEAAVRDALELPRFWPPVDHVVVSRQGDVWLKREPRQGGVVPWEIRDRNGHLSGFVRLPEEVQVLAVDGDRVWASRPDSLEVPVVLAGRLLPAMHGGAMRESGGAFTTLIVSMSPFRTVASTIAFRGF